MTRYIIETATAHPQRRAIGDASTLEDALLQCEIAISKPRAEGGPDFAFAVDDTGRFCVALERTVDGRILNHLAGR